MKKNEVKIGGLYRAKVSDKVVTVRIDSTHSAGGWNATNTRTGKRIRIKSAQRLRGPATSDAKGKPTNPDAARADVTQKAPRIDRLDGEALAERLRHGRQQIRAKAAAAKANASAKKVKAKKAGGEQKPKRVSALDAAAQVLKSAGKPMRAQELIAAMAEQGLWSSPAGKTPAATLYAAVAREIAVKKGEARFRKTGPGQFAFSG